MVKVSVNYTGDLHCDAEHGPSQSKISTDAPTDNKGKGEAFSPTDLVATALATCMSTTMGIKAQELDVDLRGMPDRWIAFGNTYSAAEGSSAARGTGTNGAELPRPQESSPRNPSSDEIFLGGVAHASRVLVSASRRNNLCLVREF